MDRRSWLLVQSFTRYGFWHSMLKHLLSQAQHAQHEMIWHGTACDKHLPFEAQHDIIWCGTALTSIYLMRHRNRRGHLEQSSFQHRLLLRPGLEPVRVCPAHCCGCLGCTQTVSLLAKGMPLQLVSMPLPHCKNIVSLLA